LRLSQLGFISMSTNSSLFLKHKEFSLKLYWN
jgi:hypothetical protein